MPNLKPFYLAPDQIKRLKNMDTDIIFFKSELRRAEYCGLDVADIRARVEKMEETRAKMLATYDPSNPDASTE